jgi:hypothetical protein
LELLLMLSINISFETADKNSCTAHFNNHGEGNSMGGLI